MRMRLTEETMDKRRAALYEDVVQGLAHANGAVQIAEGFGMITPKTRDRFIDRLKTAWDEFRLATVAYDDDDDDAA